MKLKYITAMAFIAFGMQQSKAQIKISKPAGLEAQVAARTSQKKNPDAKVKGYHILIFNGDNRSKAESIKNKFETENPGYYCEIKWDEPNFKVYAGQFTSKLECLKLSEAIKGKFPITIVVSDKISYPKID
jgi:hypothetical protein